jgi:hypothetical protein
MLSRAKGTANEEKEILIYKFNKEGNIWVYGKEVKYQVLTHENFKKIRSNPLSSPYLLVRTDDRLKLSLRKEYQLFEKRQEILFKISEGKINLFKTGSDSLTAMQLFLDLCKPPIADEITPEETIFLSSCKGQLKHGKKYKGRGFKLDIISEYPSIMKSEHMNFPYKKGKLLKLNKKEFDEMKFFKYGIYHVKITSEVNPFIFRLNKLNYYTHIDLNFAKTLKYNMEIIEDDKPNFLSYEGCLINASKLFGPFVNYLFGLKQKGYKSIKCILNCLWGYLCKKNEIHITVQNNTEIFATKELLNIGPVGNDLNHKTAKKIDIISKTYFYESNYARIGPFMLAKGRFVTAQHMLKNIDDVVYVNTDGWVLKNEPSKDLKFGKNLGDLKLEEVKEKIEINNSNEVIGFKKTENDPFAKIEEDMELYKKLNKIKN